ncbi:MAG: LemA family protein [Deltaproteobacteria bacterium]|jgi:LemA protein|nr:LemA family protein [Deltaproteobacteria bacterium]
MNPALIFFPGVVIFITTVWAVGTYNKFVKYRNRIEEAWNRIDVALKRRANLIPNLIRVIEGYSAHEAKIFSEKIRTLPRAAGLSDRVAAEGELTQSLGGLLALAEAYPDLKASSNFLDLQNSLDEIEREVQQARNRYNAYISRYNTLVESFPAAFIARKFGFGKRDYLSLELATERQMPAVDFAAAE